MADALGRHGFDQVWARSVVDALPQAVIVTDTAGCVTLWNKAAEELYGWAEHESLGRSVLELLGSAESRSDDVADLGVVASGRTRSGDRWVTTRDGVSVRVHTFTRPIVDEAGNVVTIVGSSEDVTDIRAAGQRTRDLAEHFRAALEAGGLGTWRWNMASGAVVWDERLEALYGLEPGTFDGAFDTYVSLLHPDDRDDVLRVVEDAVAARSSYRVEHRVVRHDGSVRWVAGVGGVTLDEHGAVTGTVGCSMDVTERVEQEREIRRLAEIAVTAAERERLLRERLEFVGVINDVLNDSSTIRELMASVTRVAVPRLGDWCAIHLSAANGTIADVEVAHVDPAMVAYARQLQVKFPFDPDSPTGVAAVIRTGISEFYPDISLDLIGQLDLNEEQRQVIVELGLCSSITVALKKRGRVLGAMQFVMSNTERRYTEDDVRLAENVASRIAASIENMRLQEQRREIAHTLQQSLLPATLPRIPGVEIAVRYWAAGEANDVGGDFYDVFALNDPGRWAVVIGDVCGTGPSAAALTALARHSIRSSAWHDDTPIQVLDALNHAVRESSARSFLTAVYATLERTETTTRLDVVCGGHPQPIVITARGASNIGIPGTLLGVIDDVRLEQATTTLEPGDVVVFYTDGVTDVRPPHALTPPDVLDIARVAAGADTAEGVIDNVSRSINSVLAFSERDDDIAILVLKITDDCAPAPPAE